MNKTQQLTEALTATIANLNEAHLDEDPDQEISDALSDLAETLATDDSFVGSLLAHLGNDLERATDIAFQDGYHFCQAIIAADKSLD